VAKSFFNDKYTIVNKGTSVEAYKIESTGIAWESDKEYKFKNWGGNSTHKWD
jgi:LEM3 (ligand-effect modulator 3) family / CDC50 family